MSDLIERMTEHAKYDIRDFDHLWDEAIAALREKDEEIARLGEGAIVDQHRIEAAEQRTDRLLAALRELVALKDIKNEMATLNETKLKRMRELQQEYYRRKPHAWQAARDELARIDAETKRSENG